MYYYPVYLFHCNSVVLYCFQAHYNWYTNYNWC